MTRPADARGRLRSVLFAAAAILVVGASVLPMAWWTSRAIGMW